MLTYDLNLHSSLETPSLSTFYVFVNKIINRYSDFQQIIFNKINKLGGLDLAKIKVHFSNISERRHFGSVMQLARQRVPHQSPDLLLKALTL